MWAIATWLDPCPELTALHISRSCMLTKWLSCHSVDRLISSSVPEALITWVQVSSFIVFSLSEAWPNCFFEFLLVNSWPSFHRNFFHTSYLVHTVDDPVDVVGQEHVALSEYWELCYGTFGPKVKDSGTSQVDLGEEICPDTWVRKNGPEGKWLEQNKGVLKERKV